MSHNVSEQTHTSKNENIYAVRELSILNILREKNPSHNNHISNSQSFISYLNKDKKKDQNN